MSTVLEAVNPLIESGQTALNQPAIGALKAQAMSMLAAVDMSHPADAIRALMQQQTETGKTWQETVGEIAGAAALILLFGGGFWLMSERRKGQLIEMQNAEQTETLFPDQTPLVFVFQGEASEDEGEIEPIVENRRVGWNEAIPTPQWILDAGQHLEETVDIYIEVVDEEQQIANIIYYKPQEPGDTEDEEITRERNVQFMTTTEYHEWSKPMQGSLEPVYLSGAATDNDGSEDDEAELAKEEIADEEGVVNEESSAVYISQRTELRVREGCELVIKSREVPHPTPSHTGEKTRAMVFSDDTMNFAIICFNENIDWSKRKPQGERQLGEVAMHDTLVMTAAEATAVENDQMALMSDKLHAQGSRMLRWRYETGYEQTGNSKFLTLVHGNIYRLLGEDNEPTDTCVVVNIVPEDFRVDFHYFDFETREPVRLDIMESVPTVVSYHLGEHNRAPIGFVENDSTF